MLYSKKRLLPVILLIAACSFNACNPQPKTVTLKRATARIPTAFKDSLILSIDKSPMDMAYYPVDYPQKKMVTPNMENPVARLIYSRPQKNGRVIFSDTLMNENIIQHYGKEWRLGANEATEIEFFKPVIINGNKIAAGRYVVYCIPYPDKWKIILNTGLYTWGLHIDRSKDIADIELPLIKNDIEIEYFTMLFQYSTYGFELIMAWGDMKVVMPISLN